jgi:hypothetical protein
MISLKASADARLVSRRSKQTPRDPIFFSPLLLLICVNGKRAPGSLNCRRDYQRHGGRHTVTFHLPSISDRAGRAGAPTENRKTIGKRQLAKAHQELVSCGRLFVRALTVQNGLSRRIVKQPGSKTLLREQHKCEMLIRQVARDYKNAMAEYLGAIRAVFKQ